MPIYEYHCNRCDHNFEVMQQIGDDSIKLCPKCNSDAVKKMMSAPPFHLKGTGWYATDFKDKQKNPADKAGNDKAGNDKASGGADKLASKDSKGSKESSSKKMEGTE